MSLAWWNLAMKRIEGWISREVGPEGEWPEDSHYTAVSMSALVPLMLVSANRRGMEAGCDAPLVRMMRNLAKQYAPPDPRYSGERTLVGYGKGTAGERFALPGALAVATRHCDAALSRRFQWLWEQSGRSMRFANRMLVGFEDVVIDPRLPAEPPAGASSLTRDFLASRSRFGESGENFAFFLDSSSGSISPYESGALIAYYAFGKPISLLFGNGEYAPWTREARLQNRVLAARDWKSSDVVHDRVSVRGSGGSVLAEADYGLFDADIAGGVGGRQGALPGSGPWPQSDHAANGPLHWRRQLLFLKPVNGDQEGSHYLVFRDSVSGGQPSEWTLWLMSNGISAVGATARGTAGDRLPMSDTYTASGAYGVDVDLYVASPSASPRRTMRWGFSKQPGFNGVREGLGETQDLFHLNLDGDGAYYVVAFPRMTNRERPEFSRGAAGRILRIHQPGAKDWIYLGGPGESAIDRDVGFATAAGWVREGRAGITLGLSDRGWVRHADVTFESEVAAQLSIPRKGACTVEFAPRHPSGWISVRMAGREVFRRQVAEGVRSLEFVPPGT
jgi:hypothetical protein